MKRRAIKREQRLEHIRKAAQEAQHANGAKEQRLVSVFTCGAIQELPPHATAQINELILYGRESANHGNLTHQMDETGWELIRRKFKIRAEVSEVISITDKVCGPKFKETVRLAKILGVGIGIECPSRVIRTGNIQDRYEDAAATPEDLKEFLEIVDGVPIYCIYTTNCHGEQIKRGQRSKNRKGGRPKKLTKHQEQRAKETKVVIMSALGAGPDMIASTIGGISDNGVRKMKKRLKVNCPVLARGQRGQRIACK